MAKRTKTVKSIKSSVNFKFGDKTFYSNEVYKVTSKELIDIKKTRTFQKGKIEII